MGFGLVNCEGFYYTGVSPSWNRNPVAAEVDWLLAHVSLKLFWLEKMQAYYYIFYFIYLYNTLLYRAFFYVKTCIISGMWPEWKQDSAVFSVTRKTTVDTVHQKHENARW